MSARGHEHASPGGAEYFCFTSISRRQLIRSPLPIGANSRPERVQQTDGAYSITSSARASSVGGTVMPSALAVLRLMTNSNFVGCSTGRSVGFAPFKIFVMNVVATTVISERLGPYDKSPPAWT